MANIIARKNKAAAAISGEVSSDGLNAMLGDDGDLQTLLLQAIKNKKAEENDDEEEIHSEAIQGIFNNLECIRSGNRVYNPEVARNKYKVTTSTILENDLGDATTLSLDVVTTIKKQEVVTQDPKLELILTDLSKVKNKKKISQNQLSFLDILG